MKKYLIVGLVALGACNDGGPTASSSFGPAGLPAVSEAPLTPAPSPVTPVNPGATVPNGTASPSDIEIIGLNRAGIKVTARCSGVTFYVPASGADYVDVWVPEMFGVKYANNPVNEEFTLKFAPGTYNFQLAVEKKTGDPNKPIAQDDRHRGKFTVTCDVPKPPPPPVDEPECEQVWVIDREAYTEVITVVDVEGYEEEVTTCTPQEPLPGEPIVVGYVYKLTGAGPETREFRCEVEKDGSYEASVEIPGAGVVDACVVDSYLGDEFNVGILNPKTKFKFVGERTVPGEPIPQPDKCVTETISHPEISHEENIFHEEIGHYEERCEG